MRIIQSNRKLILEIAALLAFCLVGKSVLLWHEVVPLINTDSGSYCYCSYNLAEGANHPKGYPLLLVFIRWLTHSANPQFIIIAQVILGAVTSCLAFWLVRRFARGPGILAWIIGMGICFSPLHLCLEQWVLSEPATLFVLAVVLCVFAVTLERPRLSLALLAGLLLVVLYTFRAVWLFLPMLAAVSLYLGTNKVRYSLCLLAVFYIGVAVYDSHYALWGLKQPDDEPTRSARSYWSLWCRACCLVEPGDLDAFSWGADLTADLHDLKTKDKCSQQWSSDSCTTKFMLARGLTANTAIDIFRTASKAVIKKHPLGCVRLLADDLLEYVKPNISWDSPMKQNPLPRNYWVNFALFDQDGFKVEYDNDGLLAERRAVGAGVYRYWVYTRGVFIAALLMAGMLSLFDLERRALMFLLACAGLASCVLVSVVEIFMDRYFHPVEFLGWLCIGLVVGELWQRRVTRKGRDEHGQQPAEGNAR